MDRETIAIYSLIIGYSLDLIIGDPYWLPHPIRLFGNVISWFEKKLNTGNYRFLKGALITAFLIVTCWMALWFLFNYLGHYPLLQLVLGSIMVFYGLANRNLIEEVWKVNRMLTHQGIDAGRKQLSYIVGRDTRNLTANQIRTASLETLAENLSDGVVAPLFYYAIGGIPLMFAYKMVNTLDSMIGYKSERYKDFGKFAARTDDVLNFLPARITAFLMALISFSWESIRFIFKYGNKHSSPNSGYPEAALAGILDCRFGGPNVYHGQLVEKPYIGNNPREITQQMVKKACWVNFGVSLTFLLLAGITLATQLPPYNFHLLSFR
jgi:adenosylcobinamide-phosphate synthase